jgi:hypothetical protein
MLKDTSVGPSESAGYDVNINSLNKRLTVDPILAAPIPKLDDLATTPKVEDVPALSHVPKVEDVPALPVVAAATVAKVEEPSAAAKVDDL